MRSASRSCAVSSGKEAAWKRRRMAVSSSVSIAKSLRSFSSRKRSKTSAPRTTADGTEYKFDGLMEQWHDHLARALTAHGREVYIAPETVTVMPWATSGEG